MQKKSSHLYYPLFLKLNIQTFLIICFLFQISPSICLSNLLYPAAIFWCDINQDLSHHKLNCSISNQQISSNYEELLALCFCVSIVSRFYVATLLTRQIRNKLIYIHPGGALETFHLNNLNIQKSRMLLLTELIQSLALYPPCQD